MVIMYVLITKLRASTSAESQQYRKAAKALLVLIPLLGLTYVLLLVTPTDGQAKVIFTYLQAALYSTQGFLVAVLYCFLNGEVRHCIHSHLHRWNTVRLLLHSRQAVSMRGSNASQTTGDVTNGVPQPRHGFERSSLDTQEFDEMGEHRLPLRSAEFANGNLVNVTGHNRQPQQQQLIDLVGRARTVRSCCQSPHLSIPKRFFNSFYRCRWTNRSSTSATSTFGIVHTSTSAYSSTPMMPKNVGLANNVQQNDQNDLNFLSDIVDHAGNHSVNESSKPLSLTTKISIKINCNPNFF